MAETATAKKAVDLEGLKALREVFPTRAEVTKQIEEAQPADGMEFATTEEILALFAEEASESEA